MELNTVVVIFRNDTGSYSGKSTFVAVAKTEDAAKQWIQDEVDGKHHEGRSQYARGMTVEQWLQYGTFSLRTVPVH